MMDLLIPDSHSSFDLISYLESDVGAQLLDSELLEVDGLLCLGNDAHPDLEQTNQNELSVLSEPPQQFGLMPHEGFQKLLEDYPEAIQQLLMDKPSETEVVSNITSENSQVDAIDIKPNGNESGRMLGWTEEDNYRLFRALDGMLANYPPELAKKLINWRELTDKFNEMYQQNRTKVQLYSHFRYATEPESRRPTYKIAENEAILALYELGMPLNSIGQFLVNERNEKVLALKIQRLLKDECKAKVPEGSRQAAFRKKIQEIVLKSGGLDALKENKIAKKAIQDVKHLVRTNPNLRNKYFALKQAGRPTKKMRMSSETRELIMLFRPFTYINKRRRRTTCLHGDGRRYGLNLFCLNRLLGSPLEISNMPSVDIKQAVNDEKETKKIGIEHSDFLQYAILRELMLRHANKVTDESELQNLDKVLHNIDIHNPAANLEDSENYYSNPEYPHAVSVLPPTLYTVTGLRGLICYRETLLAMAKEGCDEKQSDVSEGMEVGNEESDRKFERFLMSLFQTPWNLSEVFQEPEDNSDGVSDSDEEECFSEDLPRLDLAPEPQQDDATMGDVAVDSSNKNEIVENHNISEEDLINELFSEDFNVDSNFLTDFCIPEKLLAEEIKQPNEILGDFLNGDMPGSFRNIQPN